MAAASFRTLFLETLVAAHLAAWQRDAAARASTRAQEAADAARLPLQQAWAHRAEAAVALHDGDAARAAEPALAASARQEDAGAAVEAARSLALAGRALAVAGEPDRAVQVLERAAATFEERGAVRFRDSAERELRQLGRRIHRRSQPARRPAVRKSRA